MDICDDLTGLERRVDEIRASGRTVGFVPTMGNLHEGHLDLVRRARLETDFTIVSIFVNPFQFGEDEDFEDYPRTIDADSAALAALSTDLAFMPTADTLYPKGKDLSTRVEVPVLGSILCGVSRPGFFRGVCTVVSILLNMVRPHVAYFGEKDYQQLLIIRRMVEDLRMPVRIEHVPTRREADGLAMSSRNGYLTSEERDRAATLHRVLVHVASRIREGQETYGALEHEGLRMLRDAQFRPDYLRVLNAEDLCEPTGVTQQLRVVAAAWLGETRLIDNVEAPARQC